MTGTVHLPDLAWYTRGDPATQHAAAYSRTVGKLEVKLLIIGRQTGGIDIWVVEGDVSVNKEKSNIIAEVSSVESWVLQDSGNSVLLMNL